jgi:hypothetical protein
MYSDFVPLNKFEILKRVTQEEIYQIVTNYLPQINKYVKSPLRDDKLAGAYYEWVKGILYFKDFADPNRHIRDCFQFIMEEYNLNYNECLQFLDKYFKLGIEEGNALPVLYEFVDYSSKKHNLSKSTRKGENDILEIQKKTRKFSDFDKYYWLNRFGIEKKHLIEDDVFPLVWYKFFSIKKNEWVVVRPMDICYALEEFEGIYTKIYRPLTIKGKWLTNCTENHIGNYFNLPLYGQKLLIQKAYKDCRVVRNEGIRNTVWFQSETMFPKPEVLIPLIKRFNEIIIWYDNDEAGIIGATKLMNEINTHFPNKAKIVFLEDKSTKDPASLRETKGRKALESFLKTIY